MASYGNCYGNIVYSICSRRLRKLIMGTTMSDTSVDQGENIEKCFIMTQKMINVWYSGIFEKAILSENKLFINEKIQHLTIADGYFGYY